jgi:hypothetical protein
MEDTRYKYSLQYSHRIPYIHKTSTNQTYEISGTYTVLASFPVPGDAWSSLPFNHYKEHVIRKVQENQQGLEFDGVHQVLVNKTDAGLMDIQNV